MVRPLGMQTTVTVLFACSYFISPLYAVFLRADPHHKLQDSTSPVVNHSNGLLSTETLHSNTSKLSVSQESATPNMFVAVMTERSTPVLKRNAIRELWNSVNGGTGQICYRFVVCQANDTHQTSLVSEHSAYGDLLFLDCVEGYAKGLLTRKVIASLQVYRNAAARADAWCIDRELYMKVDDDTFVAGRRFRLGLSMAIQGHGSSHIYAGVFAPSGPAAPVERDNKSAWFEPVSTWPHDIYPSAMYGGPGYVLGKVLVQQILDQNIAQTNVLWNEDRAVGVWVDIISKKGVVVNWLEVPGTNGFSWDWPIRNGTWGAYPYALHHHLSGACISCLAMIERANNPNSPVDHCFQLDPIPDKWTFGRG